MPVMPTNCVATWFNDLKLLCYFKSDGHAESLDKFQRYISKYDFPCISRNHLIKNYRVTAGRRYKQQLVAEINAKEGGE